MKKPGLDATDIRILAAVQQHGQLSKSKLAGLVNISETPGWARLDRLKAAGFIKCYRAEIALERICDVTATGGGMDYVMTVICPNLAAFQALMEEMQDAELGVDRYMTYIATRTVKSALPNIAKLAAKTAP